MKKIKNMSQKILNIFRKNDKDKAFNYKMLYRLKMDCDYFLGFGNQNEKCLWAKNAEAHISKMKKIYKSFHKKPKWLRYKDILNYEKEMICIINEKKLKEEKQP